MISRTMRLLELVSGVSTRLVEELPSLEESVRVVSRFAVEGRKVKRDADDGRCVAVKVPPARFVPRCAYKFGGIIRLCRYKVYIFFSSYKDGVQRLFLVVLGRSL
jgi:hypothetical protein